MENDKRLLLVAAAVLSLIGLVVLSALLLHKGAKPRFGWAQLGQESFTLKPAEHHTFSYTEVPERFKLEVEAGQPVAFGFVTADMYGHFTHTIMNLDFATLPCGSAPVASATKECSTEPSKRYLLFSDPREDVAPIPDGKGLRVKNAPPPEEASLSHINVRMYEWRCVQYCDNLRAQQQP